jgi:hypothetical protein
MLIVIAVAVSVMALIQVGVIVAGIRVARRVETMARDLESGVKPLLANLTRLSAEATRTANLATAQVERVDRLFAEVTSKVEQTMSVAQQFVGGPAREGLAVVAGVRAAISAIQGLRKAGRKRSPVRPSPRGEHAEADEESLFIG